MKKIIILLSLVFPAVCFSQPSSKATLYCINPFGQVIALAQVGTPAPSNPPGVVAYGMNSLNQAVPLQCDASGNIITGSFPTGTVLPATLTSGTATCSGTINVTSTLGGALGNAISLRGLTVKIP
jgi:hypothetical protein